MSPREPGIRSKRAGRHKFHISFIAGMVGAAGFEPTTSCIPDVVAASRSARLCFGLVRIASVRAQGLRSKTLRVLHNFLATSNCGRSFGYVLFKTAVQAKFAG